MHLIIINSRLSNLLHFIQQTNQFDRISPAFKNYLTNENFDLAFYGQTESKIWKQIQIVAKEEYIGKIKISIINANPTFNKRWPQISKDLSLWKKYFLKNRLLLEQLILEVKKLTKTKNFFISQVPIYLIADCSEKDNGVNAWFSWTPKESFMVVEIPYGLKPSGSLFPLGIVTHEFFHLMLRQNHPLFLELSESSKKNEKLLTRLAKGMPNRLFLEEMLISSFVPEGYLSEKYCNLKVENGNYKSKGLLYWRKFVAFKLKNIAIEYINGSKPIDEKYIQSVINAIA